eukprot:m.73377 g.73377  ORF g.73377 m.73377 type:complete len:666 (-) comp12405_c1_seq1:37-2034(-)
MRCIIFMMVLVLTSVDGADDQHSQQRERRDYCGPCPCHKDCHWLDVFQLLCDRICNCGGRAGWISSGGGCSPCPTGTYKSSGMSSCATCPAGKFQIHTGYGYCDTCRSGSYSPGGSVICKNWRSCNPTTEYIMIEGTSSRNRYCGKIQTCKPGSRVLVQPTLYNNRQCVKCKEDEYNQPGIVNQETCSNKSYCGQGQYLSDEGSRTVDITCSDCLHGQYMNVARHRSDNCTSHDTCPKGYKHTNNKNDNVSCVQCEFNTYMDQNDHLYTECKPMRTCDAGTHLYENPGVGRIGTEPGICIECIHGFMNLSDHRHRTCFNHKELRCHAGQYLLQNATTDSLCLPCPASETQALQDHDKTYCDPIIVKCEGDEFMEFKGNSTKQTVCVKEVLNCEAGYFLTFMMDVDGYQRGFACKPCPKGTFIELSGATRHSRRQCANQPTCPYGEFLVGASSTSKGMCLRPTLTSTSTSSTTQSETLLDTTTETTTQGTSKSMISASFGILYTSTIASSSSDTAKSEGNSLIGVYVAVPLLLVLLLVVIIIIFMRKTKKQKEINEAPNIVHNPSYSDPRSAVSQKKNPAYVDPQAFRNNNRASQKSDNGVLYDLGGVDYSENSRDDNYDSLAGHLEQHANESPVVYASLNKTPRSPPRKDVYAQLQFSRDTDVDL